MTDLPLPQSPEKIWMYAYVVVCGTMFLGCLFHATKLGIWEYTNADPRDPWLSRLSASLTQIFALVFFVAGFWLLESYASFGSPYYVYSQFPGAVPQLFYLLGSTPAPATLPCPALVNQIKALGPTYNTIPLSVLMMESSITYVAMWTALMLRTRYYLVPLFTGLIALNIDVLLDPIVAVVYDCQGNVMRGGDGLAFWHWYSSGAVNMPTWYGVPLFNMAAWWAMPTAFVGLVLIFQYLRNRVWRVRRHREPIGSAPVGGVAALLVMLVGLVGVFYLLNMYRVTGPIPIPVLWLSLGFVVLATAVAIVFERRHFDSKGSADPFLTRPPLAFIAIALVALLIKGIFIQMPTLLPVALTAVVLGMLLVLWPYAETVCRIARNVIDLDRYVRLHYFGYTSMLILLGAFSTALGGPQGSGAEGSPLKPELIGLLLATAAAFHVYAYVLNDVIDLEVDKSHPKRQRDPLVRGSVGWASGLALALVQIPASFLCVFLLGSYGPAYAALAVGLVFMAVYNRWGKVCPFPPLTDFVQGIAWASLVWVGAFAAEPIDGTTNWLLVWTIFAFGAGFIFLINGVHGGLRDLRNDAARGRHTTAMLLGARWDADAQRVVSTPKLVAFAFAVHAAMFVLPFVVLMRDPLGFGAVENPLATSDARVPLASIGLLGVFLLSNFYLWKAVKPTQEDRDRDKRLERHVFIVLVAPIIGFLPFLNLPAAMILVVAFFGPLLAQSNVVEAMVWFTHPEHAAHVADPTFDHSQQVESFDEPGVVSLPERQAAAGER